MKSPIPEKVIKVRRDISSYLFHFVNRNKAPADALRSILEKGLIRGGIYPPSQIKTVCFTEAPLAEIVREDGILDSYNYKRLSLWGIGFKKQFIFDSGGLPVIYQPRSHLLHFHPSAYWRHVDFDLKSETDHTWQREWRVPVEEFRFDPREAILVIPSVEEFAGELWRVSIDVESKDGEVIYYSGVFKKWDFIPLEYADISDDTSIEVCRGDDFQDIIDERYYDKMDFDAPSLKRTKGVSSE